MKNSLSNVQYLLFALLLFSLTACGASNNQTASADSSSNSSVATGKLTANLTWAAAKSSAKTVAAATTVPPAAVQTIRLIVTGATIPTAQQDFPAASGGGTVPVYPGRALIVTAQAIDASGILLYEGATVDVVVTSGANTVVSNILMNPPVIKATDSGCIGCHNSTRDTNGQNLLADYKQSAHYFSNYTSSTTAKFGIRNAGCAGCHGPQHNDLDPAASGRCADCHSTINTNHATYTGGSIFTCGNCHVTHNTQGGGGCLGCHAVSQNANTAYSNSIYVNDNNGVRAISGEFSKNSHHVTGKILTNADCAVCHMEGTTGGAININYHMKDNRIHLRNGNTALTANMTNASADGKEYIWDPANPDHTAMDQFCMSCHNAAGSTSAVGLVSGNSARNPFNDTISNGYDQMSRTYVVAVYEQFDTGNTSHHAVRGKKYSTRTRPTNTAAKAAFIQYSGAVVGAHARANGVQQVFQVFGSYSGTAYSNAGYGPKSPGVRKTLYEAGLFTSNFTTLGSGTTVIGDDSTLHCGDCHTVGQWKPNATNAIAADGTIIPAPDAIGAHGSANEYMLRNSIGTDALMVPNTAAASATGGAVAPLTVTVNGVTTTTYPITYDANGYANNLLPTANNGTLTCYLCHKQAAYAGNIAYYNWVDPLTGVAGATRHGGVGGGDCVDGSRNSTGKIGAINRVGAVSSSPSGKSSILGILCSNCHNSGNQIFGGIHGNASSYGDIKNVGYKTYSTNGKDAMTNVLAGYSSATGKVLGGRGISENRNQQLNVVTRKPYRFMGGVSLKYSGGGSADKWEAKVLTTQHREGCYNISTTTTGLNQWSATDGSTGNLVPNYATATNASTVLSATTLPAIANGVADDLGFSTTSGSGAQNINNGASGSWGACGHHTGSAASGTSNMPKRTVQRPLNY